ncbi:alpha/beta fold hydrolase [Pseudooceanicola sp. 200-1SW]|uniref:alpha/beta fold hydrolase n=1 Tax=Pseudooceanicola sp. 200-1SW TaxID=3425949 RepID=UPI003D7F9277
MPSVFYTVLATILACLALAALLTWLRAYQRSHQAQTLYPPRGRMITVNGHPVHVLQLGSGPDVVVVHGVTSQMIEPLETYVPALLPHFRVTLIDRPGLGYTPRLNHQGESLREQAEFLDDTCAALGLDQVTLLGQSFGGSIALAWALYRPERLSSMVLVGTPAFPWLPKLPWRVRGPALPVLGPLVAQVVTAWFPQSRFDRDYIAYFAPREMPQGYARKVGLRLTLRPHSIVSDNRQLKRMQPDLAEMGPHYGEIRMPVEILFGGSDVITAPQLHGVPLSREIPGARLKQLKDQGHMVHVGGAAEIAEAVQRAARRARIAPAMAAAAAAGGNRAEGARPAG